MLVPFDVARPLLRAEPGGARVQEVAQFPLVGRGGGARGVDRLAQLRCAREFRRKDLQAGAPAQRRLARTAGRLEQPRLLEQRTPGTGIVPDRGIQ